jgi:hypothetical protein
MLYLAKIRERTAQSSRLVIAIGLLSMTGGWIHSANAGEESVSPAQLEMRDVRDRIQRQKPAGNFDTAAPRETEPNVSSTKRAFSK